jgi:hypothetical protein
MARGRKPAPGGLADPAAGGPGDSGPAAPPDLSPLSLAKWRALVPLIAELCALRDTDVDALRQYCDAAVRRDRALRELEADDLVIETPNGARQINPLLDDCREGGSLHVQAFGAVRARPGQPEAAANRGEAGGEPAFRFLEQETGPIEEIGGAANGG